MLVDWFGKYNDPQFQQFVGEALLLTAEIERKLGDYKTAVSMFDNILDRFGGLEAVELQEDNRQGIDAKRPSLREWNSATMRALLRHLMR